MIVTPTKTSIPATETRNVRRIPDWEAAGLSGLIGGLTFMALEMAFTAMSGGGIWDAPKVVASVVFGGTLGAAPSDSAVLAIALFVHFTLSLLYARVLALYLTFRQRGHAVLVGAAFGLLLYAVNAHGLAYFIPRLAAAQAWPWLLSHLGFGMVVAASYHKLERVSYE